MADRLCVLLLLDSRRLAFRVLRTLAEGGYAVRPLRARTAQAADEILGREQVDLVIADSSLWTRDHPGVPLIILSDGATTSVRGAEAIQRARLADLPEAVGRQLARREQRQEARGPLPQQKGKAAGSLRRVRSFLRSYLPLLVSILVGAAATVGVFVYYQDAERNRLRADFDVIARDRAEAIRVVLAQHETELSLLGLFYQAASEPELSRRSRFAEEFQEFAQGIMGLETDLQLLAIVPRVSAADRERFEQVAQQAVAPGFTIREMDPAGRLQPASHKGEYFPLLFVEPQRRTRGLVGLDLSSVPGIWDAMQQAGVSGRPTTSGKNRLPYPRSAAYNVWQFLPIYGNDASGQPRSGFGAVVSFAAIVFRVDRLVERSLGDPAPLGIDLEVVDGSARGEPFVYYHRSRSPKAGARYEVRTQTVWSTSIDAGQRQWAIRVYATYGFIASHRTWQSWYILVGGIVFTALAGTYFARRMRSASRIERLIQERTLALSVEIDKQRRLKQELEGSRSALTARVAELDQRNREIQLLNEMGDMFQACLLLAEAYPVVSAYAPRLLPATSGALYVYDSQQGMLSLAAEWGDSPPEAAVFRPEDCWGLRRGRMHAGRPSCPHEQAASGAASLCIPISAMGETIGLFHARGCSEQTQVLAVSVAERIGLALSNLKLRSELKELSIRDPLTHLYNRRYMTETLDLELRRAERKKLTAGIIMVDIDHFKDFNDRFGHAAGDELLRALGDLLHAHLRAGDIACRYGGEEFVLVLPEATSAVTTERAEQLRKHAESLAVSHLGRPLGPVTISAGVSVFPADGMTGEELLRAADQALYRAKTEGRNRVKAAAGQRVRRQ